ncbi:MAG: DUF4251 domain-containing protein [Bacteroidota bacterium]|nr:DUF4251 domain-containing protein [Bacteroidota bacterium]
MKTIFQVIRSVVIILFISIFLLHCSPSKKAVALNSGDINNMVNSHEFVFVAQRVSPLRGRTRNLTSLYDVTVKKDRVVCDLPFFGRAYQAPMNPTEGGIHFTSSGFSYDANPAKNNGWNVMIKPKDKSDVQQLTFNIFNNGSADLNVISTSKDAISFSGHIEKIK